MINKIAFVDIGELGWSLYLSAHIRWLKKNSDSMIAVIGFPDRRCLYADLADEIVSVPDIFYEKYNLNMQDSYKLRKVSWNELKTFFLPYAPKGYRITDHKGNRNRSFNMSGFIYMPYKYTKPPENGREIIVFPRYRRNWWRNIPEDYYLRLTERLCDEFKKLTIRTIGTKTGAYDMKIDKPNYINWVGRGENLQDFINRCQSAIAAVGGQSAPPKISLLQGVPTFMVGHQKGRHTRAENWMNTKVGFYEIGKKEYGGFNFDDCIQAAVAFVKEIQ